MENTIEITTKEDALSGKSFGVTGLYHFNPQGSYSPFVKLGWHHWSFTKQQASTNIIHISIAQIHTLKLNTIFDCLVNFPI
jgi:outer membrane protein W